MLGFKFQVIDDYWRKVKIGAPNITSTVYSREGRNAWSLVSLLASAQLNFSAFTLPVRSWVFLYQLKLIYFVLPV